MFDIDKWQEILNTLGKNKLRTVLTGFSVFWGIFMLVLLLGFGNGLQNGVENEFANDAVNSIWFGGARTGMPYKGLAPGRFIRLDSGDYRNIKNSISGVENVSARLDVWQAQNISYGNRSADFDVKAVHPEHSNVEKVEPIQGRFINDIDIREYRKTACIGRLVRDELFENEEAPGKYLKVNGIPFLVVGVYDDVMERETRRIYLPISVIQKIFLGDDNVGILTLTTGDAPFPETLRIERDIRRTIAERHKFDIRDRRAMWLFNRGEEFQRYLNLFRGIEVFRWIVGIGTLIAGIVGVSNIMMVAVKDRTRELGIRKALGATPWSIINLIVQESIIITTVAGYAGIVLGVGALELVGKYASAIPYLTNPGVDLGIALGATLLLILSGALAGFFPARKAARIKPIESLREE